MLHSMAKETEGRHGDIAPACPRVRSTRRTAQAPGAQAPHTFLAGCEGWMLLALLRGSLMFMIALRVEAAFCNISFKPLTTSTFPWEEEESQRVQITCPRSQSRLGWIQNSKANYGSKSGALSLLPLLGGRISVRRNYTERLCMSLRAELQSVGSQALAWHHGWTEDVRARYPPGRPGGRGRR